MGVGWESPWMGPSIGVFVLETVRVSQPSVVPGKWAFCDVHVQEDVMHPPPRRGDVSHGPPSLTLAVI